MMAHADILNLLSKHNNSHMNELFWEMKDLSENTTPNQKEILKKWFTDRWFALQKSYEKTIKNKKWIEKHRGEITSCLGEGEKLKTVIRKLAYKDNIFLPKKVESLRQTAYNEGLVGV